MAKLKMSDVSNTNVVKILERMMRVGKFETMTDLAHFVDVNPQALKNAGSRQSISMPLLLNFAEKLGGVSLDYLVYGHGEPEIEDTDGEPDGYVEMERIGGGPPVKMLEELLRRGINVDALRAYIYDSILHVIDTSDRLIITGIYAFGDPARPIILECKTQRNGLILVENEETPQAAKDLEPDVVGRVVWSGGGK